jgi:hypothetical protein
MHSGDLKELFKRFSGIERDFQISQVIIADGSVPYGPAGQKGNMQFITGDFRAIVPFNFIKGLVSFHGRSFVCVFLERCLPY